MQKERLQKVLKKLREKNLDQMFVTDPYAIYYLTGFCLEPDERMYVLYINQNGTNQIFINSMFAVPVIPGVEMIRFDDTDDVSEILCQAVEKGKPLGIDKTFSAKYLLPLMKKAGASDYELSTDCIDDVRAVKDMQEIEYMREASRLNDQAMEVFKNMIHEGITEKELANRMLAVYRELGAEDFSFEPSVCFGTNTAEAHHNPDDTVLKEGDAVYLDVGCKKNGYCSDMTRVFFYKKILKPEHEEIYQIVRKATEMAEAMCRPGISISEIDEAARKVIQEAGYGAYFNYRTGHFIGLQTHEEGDVSSVNAGKTVPGNIFSIEPGIFIEGDIGISIEDLVLITEEGAEILNHYTHELEIVG